MITPQRRAAFYKVLREEARQSAMTSFLNNTPLPAALSVALMSLEEMSPELLEQVEAVWEKRLVDWDWQSCFDAYRKDHRHWNCAVVANKNLLLGLALGSVSERKTLLRIQGVERAVLVENSKKQWILPLMELAWTNYAVLLGCQKVVMMAPAPHLIEKYNRLGYTVWEERQINGLSGLAKMLPVDVDGAVDGVD